MELHPHEVKILRVLKERSTPEIVSKKTNMDLDAVMRASSWLSTKNLIKVAKTFTEEIALDSEGKEYAELGLPERKIINKISDSAAIDNIDIDKKEKNIALGWLRRKNLAKIEKIEGKLTITVLNRNETCDEKLLKLLKEKELKNKKLTYNELSPELKDGFKLLKQRQNVIKIKEIKEIYLIPTDEGIKLGKNEIKSSVSQLTSEMLKTGEWKNKTFRPYDAEIYIKPKYPAKKHPLRQVIDKIRSIFLEMGFEEITGNFVESAFWNFDALFQPQDHPARDMHDTFYLKNPISIKIPKFDELNEKVKQTHENGWTTGSTGWGYDWSSEVAQKTVLRTHTTAVTARHLSKLNKNSLPVKVFCIGKTFRNEAIDYKHLPEFYQVEGIVADENANFRNLLSILKTFYNEMGFEKVRFRPAYFPYTEMSVEPEIFFEEKGEWVELGGAGIFRPEVVMPLLGFDCPVLAWGLGLDRVVALKLGMNDIRDLYISDLKWLRESKV